MKVAICEKGTRKGSLLWDRKGDLQRVKGLHPPEDQALVQVEKWPFLGLETIGGGDVCLAE